MALAQASFRAAFFRLAAANVLSNLMVPLAGIIDTAFLGHLAEIRHLAGVALATVIFNVVYWSFGFLRMGTTGMTAQAQGKADPVEVRLIALRNGAIALTLGLLILLLQVPIRELGFGLLAAEASVQQSGYDFFNARIWDAPAVLLNLVMLGWFLGQEQGRRVIVLSVVGNASNVVFNYLFIRLWGWGSLGAGLGTALSQYLMLIAGLSLILQEGNWQLWRAALPQIGEIQALKGLFRLNRDILIRTFALVISFALFTHFSSALGTQVLAANTLLLQGVTLSAYFIDGIAFATESFAGKFYGSRDRTQLSQLLRLGGITSISLGLAFALVLALFPNLLFGLLTSHGDVLLEVRRFVWWLLPCLGMGAIAYLLDGYFLGLTAGHTLRNSTLFAAGVGFLPLAFLAQSASSPHLLWLALTSFMSLRAITLAIAVPTTLR
ncbi:MAG: MATE family efflux transporter [Cyanobacteria bacterium Co-bin13]|nr:MATE family efflux transporter [Cyanobacteria bacterium Co-bin13]